jgi:endonuclease YncB( thermonuclease family)
MLKLPSHLKTLFRTIALILLSVWITEAGAFEAKVISVLDGDTIEVLKDRKPLRIRLYGIDAPEHDQDFGKKAKQFTARNVSGKIVEIVPVDRDRYDRTVAKVYVDGKYLNQMIISEGLAWHYKFFAPKEKDLADAEKEARSARKGMWSHPNPVPPWDFKRRKESSNGPLHRLSVASASLFHGNSRSRVFHKPECQHYNCKNCVVEFLTTEEAVSNGYRPCKMCNPS